jgi:WD40-like Beta Propeller Repeat
MRTWFAPLGAVVLALVVAPACDADTMRTCDNAWIGNPRIALARSSQTFEVGASGALRKLSKVPEVYSGAQSHAAWYRVGAAPHGGWTGGLHGTELSVERRGTHIVVDHNVLSGSVAWSPDGQTLAFTVRAASGARLASAANGFHVRAIRATACSPYAWSPDSTRVAFIASRTNSCLPAPSKLTVVDPKTDTITSTADLTAGVWSGPPTWSADARFVAHSHSLMAGIVVAPRSATGRSYSNDACTSARWAPVGDELATVCNGVLATIDATSGRQRLFSAQVPHVLDAPFWAPDAHALATMSDTAFTITPLAGAAATIPFSDCIAAGIAGFERANGRAVITASIAPPSD